MIQNKPLSPLLARPPQQSALSAAPEVNATHTPSVVVLDSASDCITLETSAQDEEFAHQYLVNLIDPAGRSQAQTLQAGTNVGSLELQAKLDKQHKQLIKDRHLLRRFVFPQQDPAAPYCLSMNLRRIIENTKPAFHVDAWKPSDLDTAYIVDVLDAVLERLVVVRGEDSLNLGAQQNTTMAFRMYPRAIFSTRRLSVYLQLKSAKDSTLAKNIQRELAFTTLRTASAAVEISYDSDPSSIITEGDDTFVELFLTSPGKVGSKHRLQSPRRLRLKLNCTATINCKLMMPCAAGRVAESLKTDSFVIWSEDNPEMPLIHHHISDGADEGRDGVSTAEKDTFSLQSENATSYSVGSCGIRRSGDRTQLVICRQRRTRGSRRRLRAREYYSH